MNPVSAYHHDIKHIPVMSFSTLFVATVQCSSILRRFLTYSVCSNILQLPLRDPRSFSRLIQDIYNPSRELWTCSRLSSQLVPDITFQEEAVAAQFQAPQPISKTETRNPSEESLSCWISANHHTTVPQNKCITCRRQGCGYHDPDKTILWNPLTSIKGTMAQTGRCTLIWWFVTVTQNTQWNLQL